MPGQHSEPREPWRARLNIPAYQVQEAARYAGMSPQTIRHWQAGEDLIRSALSPRDPRASLSYMQLIEVAVVAAFRRSRIPLKDIREAREYIKNEIKSEHPFAQYSFKTRGRNILIDYVQIDKKRGRGKLLDVTRGGQLAWESIIAERLKEFEYDRDLALRWHVAGLGAPVVIDPRVSFGAPAVNGVPTWVLKGRWESGEAIDEIAGDFDLSDKFVLDALQFEGIDTEGRQRVVWAN